MKESNPIQQRIGLLLEKWEAAVSKPGVSIVRMHAEENEKDMVDSFYTYLLGVDTENNDVPVIFESIFHTHEQYSLDLLNELNVLIHTWNTANKDAITIKTEQINWQPDFKLLKKDNPAYLFIENMNRFADYLNLADETYLVAVLKASFTVPATFNDWLEYAVKSGITIKFKVLIDDTVANPFYKKIADKYPDVVTTLKPALDMDNAMQQVAAMGNPNDPAVQYRQAFMKMMQAIEKRAEGDAEKYAAVCIGIATENLQKSGYWIGQVIAVYAALANDQVGYKNFKKAIHFSSLGVQAAEQSKQIIKDEFIYRKFLGQAFMLRASLYAADKKWQNAIEDFTVSAGHYINTNDIILAMEAYRMIGYSNIKFGNNDAACRALAEAAEMSAGLPVHVVKFTTFPAVIEMLLGINNFKYITNEEIEELAKSVYGNEWLKEIQNWKNPVYEQVTDASKVVVA